MNQKLSMNPFDEIACEEAVRPRRPVSLRSDRCVLRTERLSGDLAQL